MTARVRDHGHCMSGPKPPDGGVEVEAAGFEPSWALDDSAPIYTNWLAGLVRPRRRSASGHIALID